jgi:flagellar protein FliO/FliZ
MIALLLAVLLFGAAPALCAEPEATAETPAFRSPTSEPLLRGGALLGGLVMCALVAAQWARRRRGRAGGTARSRIEVIGARSLGPRHRAVLVEVDGRRLLLGLGGDAICTLAELGEEETFARTLEQRVPLPNDPGDFGLEPLGRFRDLDA